VGGTEGDSRCGGRSIPRDGEVADREKQSGRGVVKACKRQASLSFSSCAVSVGPSAVLVDYHECPLKGQSSGCLGISSTLGGL